MRAQLGRPPQEDLPQLDRPALVKGIARRRSRQGSSAQQITSDAEREVIEVQGRSIITAPRRSS